MANEATIRSSLLIQKGQLDFRSNPAAFQADVGVESAPSPGAILATPAGVNVDLTALTNPSLCTLQNLGNYRVDVGVYEPDSGLYLPLLELLPGEGPYVVRLSRHLQEEFGTTGTSVTGSNTRLRIRSHDGNSKFAVFAFER